MLRVLWDKTIHMFTHFLSAVFLWGFRASHLNIALRRGCVGAPAESIFGGADRRITASELLPRRGPRGKSVRILRGVNFGVPDEFPQEIWWGKFSGSPQQFPQEILWGMNAVTYDQVRSLLRKGLFLVLHPNIALRRGHWGPRRISAGNLVG